MLGIWNLLIRFIILNEDYSYLELSLKCFMTAMLLRFPFEILTIFEKLEYTNQKNHQNW